MSARDAAAAGPNPPSPIRWALAPIRARLMLAAALAATGTALTLMPLAGMVRIAQIALGGASGDIWTLVIASVISLFAGMALILAGELAAHLADNRLTHHLRLATRGGCPRCRWAGSRSAPRARSSRCCRTTSPRCTA